ncbi:hypothetical protein CHUAL_001467 [Chamberlinius hualienensis]
MSADNPRQRPFKVWSADRTVRKAVLAVNLSDLIRKAKVKLEIGESEGVVVVLELDGTEVDEDYFRRLPDNTVFLVLRSNERWYPPGVEAIRAAIRAIPRIVCDAINTLELIDEAPSWKIMDNRGRVTVVLHWDQRDIRKLAAVGGLPGPGGRSPQQEMIQLPIIEEPSDISSAAHPAYISSTDRRSPILITAKIEGEGAGLPRRTLKKVSAFNDIAYGTRAGSPDANGAICDFHCCALHEESGGAAGRIQMTKSVATSPIQEQVEVRRPSPKGGAHVRFLDVHVHEPSAGRTSSTSLEQHSSESDTENTANEDEQLSERYLLLVDQLSVEQKRHLTIKDIGIILERLSSKIVDVERLEREKESEDVHNWTIKATIRGEVLREIGVVYNGHYYGISEHPGYF